MNVGGGCVVVYVSRECVWRLVFEGGPEDSLQVLVNALRLRALQEHSQGVTLPREDFKVRLSACCVYICGNTWERVIYLLFGEETPVGTIKIKVLSSVVD